MCDCPLCRAERLTAWFHEEADFYICDCLSCATPMAVYRPHYAEPPTEIKARILAKLAEIANKDFGPGRWRFDEQMRAVKDHWHAHARPL